MIKWFMVGLGLFGFLLACGSRPATEAPNATNTPRPLPTVAPIATPAAPAPEATRDPSIDPAGVAPENKDDCPEAYPVKGNIRDDEHKIYHIPGSRAYSQTDPEWCFATTEDAERAGYERPANS